MDRPSARLERLRREWGGAEVLAYVGQLEDGLGYLRAALRGAAGRMERRAGMSPRVGGAYLRNQAKWLRDMAANGARK